MILVCFSVPPWSTLMRNRVCPCLLQVVMGICPVELVQQVDEEVYAGGSISGDAAKGLCGVYIEMGALILALTDDIMLHQSGRVTLANDNPSPW